jgi:hypothetical protein
MEYDDSLPPVIRILLSERKLLQQSNDFGKALRRLLPDLRRQAEWTLDNFDYEESVATKLRGPFIVLPAAAADPFTRYGACHWIDCRTEAAMTFCRTFGLYADTAILPDCFTPELVFNKRFSLDDYMDFNTYLRVLWILAPLIKAGVVRFRLPMLHLCNVHHQEYDKRASEIGRVVLPAFTQDLGVDVTKNSLVLSVTGAGGQRLQGLFPLTARRRAELSKSSSPLEYGRRLYHRQLKGQVKEMMIEHMQAINHHAALLSTSRLHMLVVKEAERRRSDMGRIEVWEDNRSALLPWINSLTPSEILKLRDEAKDALPRFRESVGRALLTPRIETERETEEVIHTLRAEAAEVKAELTQLKKSGRGVLRNVVGGTLGLTFSIYGLATGATVASAGLLLGLLKLLHDDSVKEHEQLQKIQTRPGYVLVKAEEMLRHTH